MRCLGGGAVAVHYQEGGQRRWEWEWEEWEWNVPRGYMKPRRGGRAQVHRS